PRCCRGTGHAFHRLPATSVARHPRRRTSAASVDRAASGPAARNNAGTCPVFEQSGRAARSCKPPKEEGADTPAISPAESVFSRSGKLRRTTRADVACVPIIMNSGGMRTLPPEPYTVLESTQPSLFDEPQPLAESATGLFAEIVFNRPLDHAYTYAVPDD